MAPPVQTAAAIVWASAAVLLHRPPRRPPTARRPRRIRNGNSADPAPGRVDRNSLCVGRAGGGDDTQNSVAHKRTA
eukprot:scaffold4651_cov122-Isochrysis_galbana.AAC.3